MRLDVSIPIRQTCSTDGLLCLRSATTSLWHKRCRWGPSTPSSPVAGFHAPDAPLPDLGGEHRPKPVPPEPNRLVTDLDTTLVQQILNVPERQREPDVHHDRQADDLGRRLEVLEGVAFGHLGTLAGAMPRLKPSSSDKTIKTHERLVERAGRRVPVLFEQVLDHLRLLRLRHFVRSGIPMIMR